MTTAFSLAHVVAGYGPYKALNDVTVAVEDGSSVAVVGHNGAGKSTVARVLTGLVRPSAGVVAVLEGSITTPARLARAGVVHVPEGVGLFRQLSVEENITLRVRRLPRRERMPQVAWGLDQLGDLAARRASPVGELSGGQQRRVAIIAALAAQPRLLIVDEPTMGLSPVATQAIRADLAMAAQQGCTMVLIESKLDLVQELCQRVLVMDRGQITHDGSVDSAAEALRRHYASDY